MNIGFVVNDVSTEIYTFTTINIGFRAMQMGHQPYFMGVGELVYLPDGSMGAMAAKGNPDSKTSKEMLGEIQSKGFKKEMITSKDLDVLIIRNDPSLDKTDRPWAQSAGVVFGRLAMKDGVIVLNHPDSLYHALNKMYFQHFPEIVRPKTIITRNPADIQRFYEENDNKVVIKPLQGSGGKDVFLIKETDTNLEQIVLALARDGYVIAQEYLPQAKDGDVRLMMMNGKPLHIDGKYAAFRRVNNSDDFRSNMSAGGHPETAEITDEILEIAGHIEEKLVNDGLFYVGLDIVGNKLMEINIFSPGGLMSAGYRHGLDFFVPVVEAIERKVQMRKKDSSLSNQVLATLKE